MLEVGMRVRVKPLQTIVKPLHGAQGAIVETEWQHSDGKMLMRFDVPVRHFSNGTMEALWVDEAMVEEYPQ